jgi:hypothetical protein
MSSWRMLLMFLPRSLMVRKVALRIVSATPKELVKRLSGALGVRYDAIQHLPFFRIQQP